MVIESFEYKGIEFEVNDGLMTNNTSLYEYSKILCILFPEKTWIYAEEDDYQGEWFAIGIDNDGYWFNQGSFGSCSGCDQLQAIDSIESAKEFLEMMNRTVLIGKSADEAISYLKNTAKNCWSDAGIVIDQLIEQLRERT